MNFSTCLIAGPEKKTENGRLPLSSVEIVEKKMEYENKSKRKRNYLEYSDTSSTLHEFLFRSKLYPRKPDEISAEPSLARLRHLRPKRSVKSLKNSRRRFSGCPFLHASHSLTPVATFLGTICFSHLLLFPICLPVRRIGLSGSVRSKVVPMRFASRETAAVLWVREVVGQ